MKSRLEIAQNILSLWRRNQKLFRKTIFHKEFLKQKIDMRTLLRVYKKKYNI